MERKHNPGGSVAKRYSLDAISLFSGYGAIVRRVSRVWYQELRSGSVRIATCKQPNMSYHKKSVDVPIYLFSNGILLSGLKDILVWTK